MSHDQSRPMKIGYLVRARKKRERTQGQSWMGTAWRIVDEDGQDLIQPWLDTKAHAMEIARQREYLLLERGMRLVHLEVLWDLRDHYGSTWKRYLRTIWVGGSVPFGLRDRAALLQQLRNELGPGWLGRYRLPDRIEVKREEVADGRT